MKAFWIVFRIWCAINGCIFFFEFLHYSAINDQSGMLRFGILSLIFYLWASSFETEKTPNPPRG